MSDNKDCMLSWGHFQDGLCMEFQMNRVIQTKLVQNGRRQWMLLVKVAIVVGRSPTRRVSATLT